MKDSTLAGESFEFQIPFSFNSMKDYTGQAQEKPRTQRSFQLHEGFYSLKRDKEGNYVVFFQLHEGFYMKLVIDTSVNEAFQLHEGFYRIYKRLINLWLLSFNSMKDST
ncbi:hypothetical protein Mcup_1126 [Metallosphaera cuprina Ar-4]|uniref:Uncharacterized protein n=1 Tax=Metallosphaera cuprina (strain Ar-4) TaxID=1006006 RepID=F4G333_METCR|nr:hypothetical protein Mcup_1126 [Metallosphaera cuprina Ar-4]